MSVIHCPGNRGWNAFGHDTAACFGLFSLSRLQVWRMRIYKGILRVVLHVLFVGGCPIELGKLVVKTEFIIVELLFISCLLNGL